MVSSACDDDCTGLLLNDLDKLDEAMLLVNLTGPVLVPYGILADLENATKHLKVCKVLLSFCVGLAAHIVIFTSIYQEVFVTI